jgi:hypothetical protein
LLYVSVLEGTCFTHCDPGNDEKVGKKDVQVKDVSIVSSNSNKINISGSLISSNWK